MVAIQLSHWLLRKIGACNQSRSTKRLFSFLHASTVAQGIRATTLTLEASEHTARVCARGIIVIKLNNLHAPGRAKVIENSPPSDFFRQSSINRSRSILEGAYHSETKHTVT